MKILKGILCGLLSGFATYFLFVVFSLFIPRINESILILCLSIVLGVCTYLIIDAIKNNE